jgi:hypothetical protein
MRKDKIKKKIKWTEKNRHENQFFFEKNKIEHFFKFQVRTSKV